MRRVLLALVSTVAVLVLLLGYKTTSRQVGTPAAALGSPQPSTVETSGQTSGQTSGKTGSRTVTGPVVQTRWGPVQVRLSLRNGKITDVQAVQYPNGNPRDDEINSIALPLLRSAALKAQSAQIDMVSGATVTSEGYVQSLQAALDSAHVS
jgi:uncharacterized protein with FMN-binding domain